MSDGEAFKKEARKSTFGKNLARALKDRATDNKAPLPPKKPPLGGDSFAGRLEDKLKAAEAKTREPQDAEAGSLTDGGPALKEPQESGTAIPVGSGDHVVRQGECISSIAKDTGHFWDTIWNDSANTELRESRNDPNVLLPNDRVHVPPLREKWEPRQTEARHRFRRRGWPEMLRFRILRDDEPRGNEPYTLTIDHRETTGVTDANGNLALPISPDARHAVLHIGTAPDVDRYDFTLGAIDPIAAMSGVQGRLNNLGFDCGPIDGVWGPRTEAALRRYQIKRGLQVTGQPDDPTRQRLKEDYGT